MRTLNIRHCKKRLTNINEYLAILPGLNNPNNMDEVDLNGTHIHIIPNGWSKQAYLQGFSFESVPFKKAINMFEHMEISEKIYEEVVGKPSKIQLKRQILTVLVSSGNKN